MKKFFRIGVMALAMLSTAAVSAQTGEAASSNLQAFSAALVPKSLDTLSNVDTSYLYFSSISGAYHLHLAVTYTRISGTAGGGMLLQGSDNDFTTADSLFNTVSGIGTSGYADNPTFTSLSSGSSTKHFFYHGQNVWKYKKYRVRLITSGTQTGSFAGAAYFRKPE